MGQTGTQNNLNKEIMMRYKIPYPSIEEQTAISETLSVIDNEIECIDRLLRKTINIKQGMMEELLTGRIRLQGGQQ